MLVERDYKTLLPKLMEKVFPSSEKRAKAQAILDDYKYIERERVCVGILRVSNGRLTKMSALVETANYDWRDLLVEAEFKKSFGKNRLQKK